MTIPKDSKRAAAAAADWLDVPSVDSDEDRNRRKNLYGLFGLIPKKDAYATGPLGEAIVELFFWASKQDYQRNPSPVMLEEFGKRKRIEPDGVLVEEHEYIYVEVKTRAYCSPGTAHEKIPGIPDKYRDVPKKVKVVLLADDEHKWNRRWAQEFRGELAIDPKNEKAIKQNEFERMVIDELILGTDVAKVLREYAETTIEMGG